MKKLFFVLLAAFTIFSCQKKDTPTLPVEQDVVFGVSEIDPSGGLKSTDDWECPTNMNVTHAYIHLTNGATYYPMVFRIDGILYTQAIKFPYDPVTPANNTYTIDEFLLVRDDGNGTYDGIPTDVTVMATPTDAGAYFEYVLDPLGVEFTVGEFTKTQKEIEVLCYVPKNHDKFGFNWFVIREIVIREVCFFGDICLNDDPHLPAYLNGSLYGTTVTAPDVIAIMKIVVRDDDGPVGLPIISEFTNEGNIHDALCVQYPDELGPIDNFYFDLYLWLPDGSGWSYQLYYTFTATDDGPMDILPGTDGVIDFVLGTCNYSDTDLQLNW